jgi:hypothetical protein
MSFVIRLLIFLQNVALWRIVPLGNGETDARRSASNALALVDRRANIVFDQQIFVSVNAIKHQRRLGRAQIAASSMRDASLSLACRLNSSRTKFVHIGLLFTAPYCCARRISCLYERNRRGAGHRFWNSCFCLCFSLERLNQILQHHLSRSLDCCSKAWRLVRRALRVDQLGQQELAKVRALLKDRRTRQVRSVEPTPSFDATCSS